MTMVEAATAPPARRRLRVEDVLLFAWLVISPLVISTTHGATAFTQGSDPLGGLFDIVALCAAAACIAARRADGSHSGLLENQTVAYAVGPLFGAVAFALDNSVGRLGLTGGAAILPLVAPIVAAVATRLWLQPTTAVQRRALVTPFLLATSGFFGGLLSSLTDLFDLRTFADGVGSGRAGEVLLVAGFGIAGILIFYLMLIFAPRQIAEREGTPGTWAIRFGVFVVGLVLGTTLAGVVGR